VSVSVESLEILVLDLPDLIEIKKETIRDKDEFTIAILQHVLDERTK
jgi:hypothetical protein